MSTTRKATDLAVFEQHEEHQHPQQTLLGMKLPVTAWITLISALMVSASFIFTNFSHQADEALRQQRDMSQMTEKMDDVNKQLHDLQITVTKIGDRVDFALEKKVKDESDSK